MRSRPARAPGAPAAKPQLDTREGGLWAQPRVTCAATHSQRSPCFAQMSV
jgi:hypothetical protein